MTLVLCVTKDVGLNGCTILLLEVDSELQLDWVLADLLVHPENTDSKNLSAKCFRGVGYTNLQKG